MNPFTNNVTPRPRFPAWLVAALLALLTITVFWPATRCDFINYDDNLYVTSNVHVQNGLTWENLKWTLCNPVAWNWQPVTVLSHMLDCQIYGLDPGGHHLTNVLLHALNTVLVFLLLHRLTGAFWRSVAVAALFGVHPLHVESVAWVAERKDVLSTFFGLLALVFYARYAIGGRKSEVQGQSAAVHGPRCISRVPPSIFFLLSLGCFALGLMSKPMLVTWPFVMLLLDCWPLQRVTGGKGQQVNILRLLLEKIPFLALATAGSVVTFAVQKQGGAMWDDENLPLGPRIGNALISYCRYLGKLFWPADLAVFYPHPGNWPTAQVLLAGALLLGITVLLLVNRRRYPFLLMGWLWFGGTLVPVIGLVQVGAHAMADRYAYIPSLGVLIFVTWGASALARPWRYHVVALTVAGSAALVLCVALTRQQLGYWQNSETLFRHALAVTENNYLAHNNLGGALGLKGQTEEAIRQFQEAIRLKPDNAEAHYNFGFILDQNGQTDKAIRQYLEVIRLKPDNAQVRYQLGTALLKAGQTDEAIRQYQEAIRLNPDYAEAHGNLGAALVRTGQTDEAVRQYQEAIRLKPEYAEARYNLGTAFGMKGQIDEALLQFQEVIRLKPDYAEARNNLGIVLGMKGQTDEAIHEYQEAIRLKPDYAEARNNFGIALVRNGQLAEAVQQFQEAIRLKPDYLEARNNLARILGLRSPPAGP